jgi:apolipoprotein D and lipocalin family protein
MTSTPSALLTQTRIAALVCAVFALPAAQVTAAQVTAAQMAAAQQPAVDPVVALPSLNVPAYMGTWYQVAWFPNRFQKQCVSDTAATYRQLANGELEVKNQCKVADGQVEVVVGVAKPSASALRGTQLEPAQLQVSFLPKALRWLPIWGSYWVLRLADDGRYAVVSEPQREFLWVLSRTPSLAAADETAIRSYLQKEGFDLTRWQNHSHTGIK